MEYIIKSIGILIAVLGVVFSTMPSLMTAVFEFVKKGKNVYGAAVIRIVLGGLLLWASPVATIMWMPLVIGILMVASGILIFVLGIARCHAFISWWEAKPEHLRRAMAIVAAFIGILLIYSA
ncbi:MAG: hypothetical protein ABH871_05745 [Pseudomonadota bacterium]